MTRRMCESCKHFKAAGFDKMGWCTHPNKQENSSVQILVRSAELACRNEWAHDLWEAKADSEGSALRARPEALAPVSNEEFAALTANQMLDGRSAGQDVQIDTIVGEAPVIGASDQGGDRVSLRRAKEELKLRNRGVRYGELPVSGISDDEDRNDVVYGQSRLPSQAASMSQVPPVSREEVSRSASRIVSNTSDDSRFNSIPERAQDVDLPLLDATPKQRVIKGRVEADDVMVAPARPVAQPVAATRPDDDPIFERVPELPPVPVARRNSAEPVQRVARQAPIDAPRIDAPAVQRPAADAETIVRTNPVLRPAAERREAAIPTPVEPRVVRDEPRITRDRRVASREERRPVAAQAEAVGFDDEFLDDQPAPVRRRRPVAAEIAEIAPPVEAGESYTDLGDEGLGWDARRDKVVAITPLYEELPQMCRTCKDFRPVEQSGRGWCRNQWAFGHQRMVTAEELPCETTLGNWWVPSEEACLEPFDISAHASPTPLVEQWLAARHAAEGKDANGMPLRRRKQS